MADTSPPLRSGIHRTDAGETLIELLLAVAIVAIAGVAILGGLFTGVATSAQHRDQASAAVTLRSFAESVNAASYVECSNAGDGTNAATAASAYRSDFGAPSGYATSVTVKYWDGNTTPSWLSAPPACPDNGLQQLSLSVGTGSATETVVLYKRRHMAGEVP